MCSHTHELGRAHNQTVADTVASEGGLGRKVQILFHYCGTPGVRIA